MPIALQLQSVLIAEGTMVNVSDLVDVGRRTRVLLLTIALASLMMPGAATAENIVTTLVGSWDGSGRITYTDGSTEGIRCTAYYTGSGSNLGMAIQCRSDKNPIHIRSKLKISGSSVSGNWEERTFNASGSASGRVGPNSMSLSVEGGGFSGSMAVSFSRSSHTVSITTQGIAMSKATMKFNRR